MRAWRVESYGEPAAALRQAEAPAPEPGPRQLRVRVLAAPANFPDVLLCRGEYQVRPDLPSRPASRPAARSWPSAPRSRGSRSGNGSSGPASSRTARSRAKR